METPDAPNEKDGSRSNNIGREQAPRDLGKRSVNLSKKEGEVHIERPTLKEEVARGVMKLFTISLYSTLAFAGVLVLIDAMFIAIGVIKPEQRLMTENIVMTFVTATVVQVGAAIGAIVFAVFKEPSNGDTS